MDKFCHLHLHTEYSFLDGFSKVWDTAAKEKGVLIKRLEEIEQPYCAITDHGSTAGWVRFDKACKKGNVKPIFGVEGYYCNNIANKGLEESEKLKAIRGVSGARERKQAVRKREAELGLSRRSHFVALAMNQDGLIEIQKTLTTACVDGFYVRPRWDFNMIKQMRNCIFLSGCHGGIFNYWGNFMNEAMKAGDKKSAKYMKSLMYDEAAEWKAALGDRLYIELMAIDWKRQEESDLNMYQLANKLDIPIVITNDPHYVYEEDWEGHDVLLALQSSRWTDLDTKDVLNDPKRMKYDMHDLYVKTRKEMFKSFRKHHQWLPKDEVSSALSRTLEIAERCHHDVIKKKMIMPVIKVPNVKGLPEKYEENTKLERYFLALAFNGWKRKVIPHIPKKKLKTYKERFYEEIRLIMKLGFTPYFILCNRLMKWVDENEISRGPARGSSAGSLVSYLLDITMIDPIPHDLLFSRFIDPNRTDFPDVDMDFEDTRRHEVVQYFIDTYGADRVAMLGNNMVFKSKMALKDVSRLFKYEYDTITMSEIQHMCDLVIERSGADSRLSFCLEDTFKQFDFAKEFKSKYPKVAKFSQQLEGMTKQQGVHAAAVVIADGDINQYTALRPFDKNSNFKVSQMDKHDAEDIGILKMDVLGLNTMGIIAETKRLIKSRHGKNIDIEDLCRDVSYTGGDPKVYRTFADAKTVGIFQFMSPGLTRLSKQVQVEKFGEISDATALHRPGPIHSGAMNRYPACKFGRAKEAKPLHQIIAKWTKDTYGLIIYQEQVMQIVRELGGFNWEQTNTVRKVMSKSGGAEYFMKTFWPTWKKNCKKKGLDKSKALKAFKRIMSFGSWAFNKSHSVSYAMVSYICMWFKVHYPIEFATAYLNVVKDNTGEKIQAMIRDCDRMRIAIREPNVNVSERRFVIHGDAIVASISDVKHVGVAAVKSVIENQPFKGLLDFVKRTDSRGCNKRAIENLIKAGAFDDFGYNKKELLKNLKDIVRYMRAKTKRTRLKAKELIKGCKGKEGYTKQQIAELKHEVSPIAVGKHIVEYYDDVTKRFASHVNLIKLEDIELDEGRQQGLIRKRKDVWVMGLLTHVDLKRLSQEVKEVITQEEEKRYALANLEDETDFIVCSFREAVYERYEQKLHSWKGKVLLVKAECNVGWKKLYVNRVWILDDLRKYLKNGRKPKKFHRDYLFEHPIKRYFKKVGGIEDIRTKYNCKPLIKVTKMKETGTIWCIGVVTDIQTRTIRRGDYEGKEMHIVFFEDETFQGSFILYPSDHRFKTMKKDIFALYKTKTPFMLRVQRDYRFKSEDAEYKQVSISIHKKFKWKDMIRTPFKLKGKK
jgi:DNA polymerase-3 subunit alpha